MSVVDVFGAGIPLSTNFALQSNLPVDARLVVANEIKDIAKKQKENNIAKEELNLSEEELTFLYSKALEEL